MVEEKLTKAALNGDWILLENLNLVEEWLPVLEDKLAKWKENEINTKNDIREMYELIKAFSKIREETYVLVDSDDHDYKRMTLKELNSKLDNV